MISAGEASLSFLPNQPGHLLEPLKTEMEPSVGCAVCCGLTWLPVTGPQTKMLVGTWPGGLSFPKSSCRSTDGQKPPDSPTVLAPWGAVAVLGQRVARKRFGSGFVQTSTLNQIWGLPIPHRDGPSWAARPSVAGANCPHWAARPPSLSPGDPVATWCGDVPLAFTRNTLIPNFSHLFHCRQARG